MIAARSHPIATREAILTEYRAAQAAGQPISDACARAIADYFHNRPDTRAHTFATTGAITDASPPTGTGPSADAEDLPDRFRSAPGRLWWEIFGRTVDHHGRSHARFETLDREWWLVAILFGAHLDRCTARGPQPGWSRLRL